MILMISAQGNELESQVNPRFGRTPWFIMYDTQNQAWEAFENQSVFQRGGAGISSAQFLIDQGVQVAISGAFGPNAFQALSAGNIKMVTFNNDQLTVQEIIDAYQAGKLQEIHQH